MIARADKLGKAVGQQVSEFGIGSVVDIVVGPKAQQLAVFVGGQLDVHEGGRALSGVGDVLELVEHQGNRPLANQGGNAQYSLVRR